MDKKLFESLAKIGLGTIVRPLDEMREEGWVTADDIAKIIGLSSETTRRKLVEAVEGGTWEKSRAKNIETGSVVSTYREIKK